MHTFRDWLLISEADQKDIPGHAIRIHLPKVEQQTDYSCGAAAFRAICAYFDVGPKEEDEAMKLLKTNSQDGTPAANIVKVAKEYGLGVRARSGMKIRDLKTYIEKQVPVICAMQAYGDKTDYSKETQDGHYIVAIGYDDKNIYFEDPSIDGSERGFLSYEDFENRWHDEDAGGIELDHYGIAVWLPDHKPHKKINKARKIE